MGTWSDLASRSRRVTHAVAGGVATEAFPGPTDEPASGVLVAKVDRIKVVLKAAAGQTFTGAGTWLAGERVDGRWTRAPGSDDAMDAYAGLSEATLVTISAGAVERFMLVPNGIGVSGGVDVTVDYRCMNREGEAI